MTSSARRWARLSWIGYLTLYLVATAVTIAALPQAMQNYRAQPVLWAIPALGLVAVALIGFFLGRNRPGWAFVASCVSIGFMMSITAASLFPRLVPALHHSERSLTIYNASSSERSLTVILIMAMIGMPLVIGYTVWVYRAFAGKVTASDDHSY